MGRHIIKEEYLSGARTRHPSHTLCYSAVNIAVLCRAPASAKRLLDLGCGTGALGRELKETTDREVVGVTYSKEEAAFGSQELDRVIVCDLNDFDPENLGEFDCIICSHVLEHLYQPEQLLVRLRPRLSVGGQLIVALPNILFWKQRIQFLRGRFLIPKLVDSAACRLMPGLFGHQFIIVGKV
jgi:2-polyprenyl-3-methyl-5-hydroxy-6-metoxy-1,4-benzoquinol methylase